MWVLVLFDVETVTGLRRYSSSSLEGDVRVLALRLIRVRRVGTILFERLCMWNEWWEYRKECSKVNKCVRCCSYALWMIWIWDSCARNLLLSNSGREWEWEKEGGEGQGKESACVLVRNLFGECVCDEPIYLLFDAKPTGLDIYLFSCWVLFVVLPQKLLPPV